LAVQLHAIPAPVATAKRSRSRTGNWARMRYLQRFFDIGRTGGKREPCALGELIDDAVALFAPASASTPALR